MPDGTHSLDLLLEHRDWVRRLAHRLVHDAVEAEDVAQQVWLSAVEATPEQVRSPRAWLGTLARRTVARRRRTASRRDRREELYGDRGHREAPPDEVVARAESHRNVVDAVLQLSPRLREAVLLHYFEGLPVREVAARLGDPVETVRSRLRLARGRLRDRLAPSPDVARRTGVLALAGVNFDPASAAGTSGSSLSGALAMTAAQKSLTIAAVVVAGLAGVAWFVERGHASSLEDELRTQGERVAALEADAERAERDRARLERTSAGATERAAELDDQLARTLAELATAKADAAAAARRAEASKQAEAEAESPAETIGTGIRPDTSGPSAPRRGGDPEETLTRRKVLAALEKSPDSEEHLWAIGQLIDWLEVGGRKRAWSRFVLEQIARDANVGPNEAVRLEAAYQLAESDSEERAVLAAAAAAGWTGDGRLDGFLRNVTVDAEPRVHRQLLRTLDHHPSEAFSDHVIRLVEGATDAIVLASVFDEDRAVAAAKVESRSTQVVEAYAKRLHDRSLPDDTRTKCYLCLALAGLRARHRAASELRSLAGHDESWSERLTNAAQLLESGRGTADDLEDLLD